MKHVWSILCEKTSIDSQSNLLSIFNCVEELTFTIDKTKLPPGDKITAPIELQLVNFWIVDDHEKDATLEVKAELFDPTGKNISHFENKFDIKKGTTKFRNKTIIQGLPISIPGRYILKVLKREAPDKTYVPVAELPYDVKITFTGVKPAWTNQLAQHNTPLSGVLYYPDPAISPQNQSTSCFTKLHITSIAKNPKQC